jgi:hypothetical protein
MLPTTKPVLAVTGSSPRIEASPETPLQRLPSAKVTTAAAPGIRRASSCSSSVACSSSACRSARLAAIGLGLGLAGGEGRGVGRGLGLGLGLGLGVGLGVGLGDGAGDGVTGGSGVGTGDGLAVAAAGLAWLPDVGLGVGGCAMQAVRVMASSGRSRRLWLGSIFLCCDR